MLWNIFSRSLLISKYFWAREGINLLHYHFNFMYLLFATSSDLIFGCLQTRRTWARCKCFSLCRTLTKRYKNPHQFSIPNVIVLICHVMSSFTQFYEENLLSNNLRENNVSNYHLKVSYLHKKFIHFQNIKLFSKGPRFK